MDEWAFLAGSLALVGLPPFAGFFSKDAIIAAALHAHWYGVILWVVALIGTFLTGLYTFRLYFIVFGGERCLAPLRGARHRTASDDGREGPLTMLVPVGVLAVLAVIGGWIQFAPLWHPLTNWLDPVAHARRRRAEGLAGARSRRLLAVRSVSPASASRGRSTGRPPRRAAHPGAPARARAQALLRRGLRPLFYGPPSRSRTTCGAPSRRSGPAGRRRVRRDRRSKAGV